MKRGAVLCTVADHNLPDAGGGMCCYGAAAHGPGHCTCWRPVYDLEQQPIRPGPMPDRARMCGDCAFRSDSPEKLGQPGRAHSGEGELDELVFGCGVFACHRGMRRVLRYEHPSGAVIDAAPGDYDPPIVDGVAYCADGTPAGKCAGQRIERITRGRRAARATS